MRIPFSILIALVLLCTFGACRKKPAENSYGAVNTITCPAHYPIPVYWDIGTYRSINTGYSEVGPSYLCADGVFVSCDIRGDVKDRNGVLQDLSKRWQSVMLYYATLPIPEVNTKDTVTLNDTVMRHMNKGRSYRFDTDTALWSETGTNRWSLTHSDSLPLFSVNVPGTMPVYTAVLSGAVSRFSGLMLTFTSANTANADSAYVVLFSRNPGGGYVYSNIVNAKGGTAVIQSAAIKKFDNAEFTLKPPYSISMSSSVFSGGFMVVVLYNHTSRMIGGRKYEFVNQRQYISIVNYQ